MTWSRPEIQKDYINVVLHKEDLLTLIELLGCTIDFYTKVAVTSLNNGDENSMQIFTTRAKLMVSFNERLKTHLMVGEPTSREIH